jgi:hypothetical protein
MAYLYRHIRLDKNEPFYIGIGSDVEYKRAYSKQKRNRYWNHIVNKYEYEVEIMIDDLTWEEACEKEKEFIALYGREDLGIGTLTNLTFGGDGVYGLVFNEESRKKMSFSQRNKKPISEETRERMRKASRSRDTAAHLRGVKPSKELIEKRRQKMIGVKKITKQCPYCGLIGGAPQMAQWHFDNCKQKNK